jgi:outer membrane protein assembly factor BamB
VACSASGTSSSSTIGLITYGQDSTSCDHVMAVDLSTGRTLWSDPGQNPYTGNAATGALAVAGNAGIVLTDDGLAGVNAQSGTQRWTLPGPTGCVFQQLAASGDSAIALAACDSSYYVVSINPATGKAAWQYHVTEPSSSYQFEILSASPVVVGDEMSGPRGASTIRVFSPAGTMTSAFSDSGIPLAGGTVTLNTATTDGFDAPVAVADGMLVGVTNTSGGRDAVVGYRLSDGARQWLIDTPDEVNDATLHGGELVFIDESDPAYSLEEVGVTTGTPHSLGFFPQGILESGDSGMYSADGRYLIVNQHGDSSSQAPVAAITVPAKSG